MVDWLIDRRGQWKQKYHCEKANNPLIKVTEGINLLAQVWYFWIGLGVLAHALGHPLIAQKGL